jgi:hypothetical protein
LGHVSWVIRGFSKATPCAAWAQRVYGNEFLAYLLADANGLQGDDALVAGSSLTATPPRFSVAGRFALGTEGMEEGWGGRSSIIASESSPD